MSDAFRAQQCGAQLRASLCHVLILESLLQDRVQRMSANRSFLVNVNRGNSDVVRESFWGLNGSAEESSAFLHPVPFCLGFVPSQLGFPFFFYVSASAKTWVVGDRFEWWPQYLQLSEHNMRPISCLSLTLKGDKETRPKQFLLVFLKKYSLLSLEVGEPSNYLSVLFSLRCCDTMVMSY